MNLLDAFFTMFLASRGRAWYDFAMARVSVNGVLRDINDGASVRELLSVLDVVPRLVVVEINKKVVYPEQWNETLVADGDLIEIVSFVGGG